MVGHAALGLTPQALPPGRLRHAYGAGPFAKLRMPPLPREPGLYLWEEDGVIVYVGQTRMPLAVRLGPQGYATISNYNTFARQPGRTNGGQQTNCCVNALANRALAAGHFPCDLVPDDTCRAGDRGRGGMDAKVRSTALESPRRAVARGGFCTGLYAKAPLALAMSVVSSVNAVP